MKKQKLKKGSFTVEAACVMSLVLFTLTGLLYLCFFVHNRTWFTAAACESALAGSMEGVREEGKPYETAALRSRELGNTGFFGAQKLSCQVQDGKEIQVSYTADTVAGFGGFHWKLKTEGKAKILKPARWVRKIKAAEEALGTIGG